MHFGNIGGGTFRQFVGLQTIKKASLLAETGLNPYEDVKDAFILWRHGLGIGSYRPLSASAQGRHLKLLKRYRLVLRHRLELWP
jgi:hypothetical protein